MDMMDVTALIIVATLGHLGNEDSNLVGWQQRTGPRLLAGTTSSVDKGKLKTWQGERSVRHLFRSFRRSGDNERAPSSTRDCQTAVSLVAFADLKEYTCDF